MKIGMVEDSAHCASCDLRARSRDLFGLGLEAEDNDAAAAGALLAGRAFMLGLVAGLSRSAELRMCRPCYADFMRTRTDVLREHADTEIPKSTLCACERCRNAS